MKNILQSKTAKVLAIATVVFAAQQLSSTSDVETAQAQQDNLHKASLSCQNWSEQGYGEMMGCK